MRSLPRSVQGDRGGRATPSASSAPTKNTTPRASASAPKTAGPAGAKLHTARSGNDQVATDLRLWCKRELAGVARGLHGLQTVLHERAVAAGDTYLPGYTHLQRAQPVLLTHHLLAHGW